MTVPLHAAPFAASIRLTGCEQVSSVFAGWQGEIEQISSGRFEGTLQIVGGGLVRILDIEGNQKIRLQGHHTSGLISAYPVIAGCAANVWQGRRLAPGRLVVHGIQAEVDHHSGRQCYARVMSFRPDALEDAVRSLTGTDDCVLHKTNTTYSPPPNAFDDLNARLVRLLSLGTTDPSVLKSSEGRLHEQECVRALAAALFSETAPLPDLPLSARSRLLRRAEEYMRSRLTDPVSAIDLCRELGVSDRTLRLAFLERYGVGPMTYYRFLRLNAVRYKLQTDQEIAIADAAREFGFHHLGNFAADYRRLFGMRPSKTDRLT